MDAKREVTSVDLRALCQDLRTYLGARVDKAYLYERDLIRLKLRDFDVGRIELLIEVGDRKRISVTPPEYVEDAPERPPNFARMLRNQLAGARLEAVEQHEFDRIVRLDFLRDDERTTIVAELFGDGNLAVLDATDTVVDALRTVRLKSRTVAPGSVYEFPDARLYPFDLDRDRFEAHLRDSDADVVRTLATQLNLGGTYAEEVCARGGVEAEQPVADVTGDTIDDLHRVLSDIGNDIRSGTFDPVIVSKDEDVVDVTPFPLEIHDGLDTESQPSMNDAVAEYFHRLRNQSDQVPQSSARPDFEAEIAKYDRMIEQQAAAIENFETQEARMRDRAEALYAHYELVDDVLSTVRSAREAGYDLDEIRERIDTGAAEGLKAAQVIDDIQQDGTVHIELEDLTIPVDPRHGVERNADDLYTEAKRIAEKRAGAEAALEDSREEQEAVKARREGWETPAPSREPTTSDEPVDWLSRASIPVRKSDDWYEQFRWFRTSDGFLVIGGRNADQNEDLVKKYMEPGDRFFHAQAHGGPVTILKATAPSEPSREVTFPESTIDQAAQFAISYSSVWKAGQFGGEVYHVGPDQVSKKPESGEYIQKGGFVIRGDREYVDNVPAAIAIGISCEPVTRVIGGPPEPIRTQSAYHVEVEPGNMAKGDVAKRIYREFREAFADTTFVRKVASPDLIQGFLPPGHSRIVE